MQRKALSWNEIKIRAISFSHRWAEESSEDAEAKSFLDEFFEVFGISRRRVASFETRVKKLDNRDGYIDLLWKGTLLVEMKSRGKDLARAYQQAIDYFPGIKEYDLPKYIMISDFARISLQELETGSEISFPIQDLHLHIKHFGFIAGYQTKLYPEQDPVNIKAADLLGKLHDELVAVGYKGHELRLFLVRVLFCLFAEDTGIFEKVQFQEFIEQCTDEDGRDLAAMLNHLFYILNTPEEKRLSSLDEDLASFRYVNGELFSECNAPAAFNREMRETLLKCCALDWSRISPAIFGSMFQNVMDDAKRHSLGAHYTSEINILKVIGPLFLDELWKEFNSIKSDKKKLEKFHNKLATLTFMDPACGCGNFLVITYREIRLLEIEVIKELQKGQMTYNVANLIKVDIHQFYGIEYEEFPAQIAEVALWLTDHQMNMKVSADFGEYYVRLPLRKETHILNANALTTSWEKVVAPEKLAYIIGNPPFLGHHLQSEEQKSDLRKVLRHSPQAGVMDYVAAWYVKAAEYIQGTDIRCAFVSTNSITQGEQVGILWDELINRYKIKIQFAHQTFKWTNEARGKAAVYCVIIGFGQQALDNYNLYQYSDIKGEPTLIKVSNINPYLIEGRATIIRNRSTPICNVPAMQYGSKPTDNGHFLLTPEEYEEILKEDQAASKLLRPFIGAQEFINGKKKYCIWLVNANPADIRKVPSIHKRVKKVEEFRSKSKAETTRNYPYHTLFRQITQPQSDYILVPLTTSENRKYIPLGFFSKDVIVGNTCNAIPDANLFHFGVLSSAMHMAWVSYTCGRLKSDFRYSKDIVYNNFPWPAAPSEKGMKAVAHAAEAVLKARQEFPDATLADLYDATTMPLPLLKAHAELDKAVDLCYRAQPFPDVSKRMEFLFDLYETYTAGLFPTLKTKKKRK